jgi:hypothetical protein
MNDHDSMGEIVSDEDPAVGMAANASGSGICDGRLDRILERLVRPIGLATHDVSPNKRGDDDGTRYPFGPS